MMVMAQRGGTLSSISCTARTCPVTVDPSDRMVAGLPLNCAIRKRRTSFWSAVSNVNMEFLSYYHSAADLGLVRHGRHVQFNLELESGTRLVDFPAPKAFRNSRNCVRSGW